MSLDDTLSVDMKDAIELNIFPDLAEGKKDGNGKYPDLKGGQFADPANRAFPVDTKEHARAAMVYLNKYHNNPGKGGVTADYSEAKFKEVHARIVKAMKKFGIEHDGCEICRKSKDSAKGGIEDMPEEVKQEVEDTEAEETSEEEVTTEETEASEEEEVLDTDVEPDEEEEAAAKASDEEVSEETTEEEVSEEVVSEEEVSEEPEATASEESPADKLRSALTVLTDFVASLDSSETEASVEEEADEVTKLSEELAKAHEEIAKYKAVELGSSRIGEIEKLGITFDAETKASKIERLGTMSDEDFSSYMEDIALVVKSTKPAEEATASVGKKKEPTGIETPPQFLPNIEDPITESAIETYKKLYA